MIEGGETGDKKVLFLLLLLLLLPFSWGEATEEDSRKTREAAGWKNRVVGWCQSLMGCSRSVLKRGVFHTKVDAVEISAYVERYDCP